ncbi:hypothetical protein BHE74_00054954 [Ensete ventricosum]|nr:hypothetical protein BHE74_00054954 [Ensete ventricosum]
MGSDNLKLTIDERRVNRIDIQQQGLAKTANFTSQVYKICKSSNWAKDLARSRKREKRLNVRITHFQLPPTKNFLAISEERGDDAQIQKIFPLAWANGKKKRVWALIYRRLWEEAPERREAMETRGRALARITNVPWLGWVSAIDPARRLVRIDDLLFQVAAENSFITDRYLDT